MLDNDQRSFFARHGWLVVRGVFAVERVRELELAVDAIYRTSPPPLRGTVWEVAGVSRASPASPAIAAHARDAAVGELAAQALDCPRVQLLQDTVLVKPAATGGPVAWHQDHTYTGYLAPARACSVRLALTDDTADSGCLEVIDASHALGLLGDVRALTEPSVADALGARIEELRQRVVTVELRAGDLSIHHCLTLHRSGDNTSARTRKTLITRTFDSACTLLPDRLPAGADRYFPTDGEGHLDEAAFPVLWAAR